MSNSTHPEIIVKEIFANKRAGHRKQNFLVYSRVL